MSSGIASAAASYPMILLNSCLTRRRFNKMKEAVVFTAMEQASSPNTSVSNTLILHLNIHLFMYTAHHGKQTYKYQTNLFPLWQWNRLHSWGLLLSFAFLQKLGSYQRKVLESLLAARQLCSDTSHHETWAKNRSTHNLINPQHFFFTLQFLKHGMCHVT